MGTRCPIYPRPSSALTPKPHSLWGRAPLSPEASAQPAHLCAPVSPASQVQTWAPAPRGRPSAWDVISTRPRCRCSHAVASLSGSPSLWAPVKGPCPFPGLCRMVGSSRGRGGRVRGAQGSGCGAGHLGRWRCQSPSWKSGARFLLFSWLPGKFGPVSDVRWRVEGTPAGGCTSG